MALCRPAWLLRRSLQWRHLRPLLDADTDRADLELRLIGLSLENRARVHPFAGSPGPAGTAVLVIDVRSGAAVASETEATPTGLLAIAGHPCLATAWRRRSMSRRGSGRCRSLRASATCLARRWRASFSRASGGSASDLLTDIRMTIAANELKKTMSTAVAEAVGYQSEAALSARSRAT